MYKNSKKAKEAETSREYTINMKSYLVYCPICSKRCGIFDAYCGPESNHQNRNWKKYRMKQYE